MGENRQYTAPVVADYGDLVALTAAFDFSGIEDGANKNLSPHHDDSGTMLP